MIVTVTIANILRAYTCQALFRGYHTLNSTTHSRKCYWDLHFTGKKTGTESLSDSLKVTMIISGGARTGRHSRLADSVIKV